MNKEEEIEMVLDGRRLYEGAWPFPKGKDSKANVTGKGAVQ